MKNMLKEKLKSGEIVFGFFILEFATPGIGQMVANAGFDFVLFDMEHGVSFTQESVRISILSAKAAGITPVVRVPDKEYFLISLPLDAGAEGVMFPRVETRDHALKIVESVKYPPVGKRGAMFSIAHDDYKGGDAKKYWLETTSKSNEETLTIVQIETKKGVENVDEILSVQGIDIVWIGQCDLTISLGVPGQYSSKEYLRARDKVINACEKYGVVLAFLPSDIPDALDMIGRGVRCIGYSADVLLFQSALKTGLGELKESIGKNLQKLTQRL